MINKIICPLFGCKGYTIWTPEDKPVGFVLTCLRCRKKHEFILPTQEERK